jgi:hypothetical protein
MRTTKLSPGSKSHALDNHLVAGLFQLPGDPLRPGPVGAGVGDEEVCRLDHPPPSARNLHSGRRSTATGKAAGSSLRRWDAADHQAAPLRVIHLQPLRSWHRRERYASLR